MIYQSPTSASPGSSPIVDNFPLNDSLVVILTSSPFCAFPVYAFAFIALDSHTFAFDLADAMLAFTTNLFGKGHKLKDIILLSVSIILVNEGWGPTY